MSRTPAQITAEDAAFVASLAPLTAWEAAECIRGRFGGTALPLMVERLTASPGRAVNADDLAGAIAKLEGAKASLEALQRKL